jgi:hypothetical protein
VPGMCAHLRLAPEASQRRRARTSFGFGGDEDGDNGVGVFPERENILMRVFDFVLARRGVAQAEVRQLDRLVP